MVTTAVTTTQADFTICQLVPGGYIIHIFSSFRDFNTWKKNIPFNPSALVDRRSAHGKQFDLRDHRFSFLD